MTVRNRAQSPILLNLAADVAAPAVGASHDAQWFTRVQGVVDFGVPDAANEARVQASIDGIWASVATVIPGATLPSGGFELHGPVDFVRVEVKALGVGAVANVRAYGE